ncbi:MAG: hypothetical protein WCA10_24785 [Terracidiphilus sp.]
MLEGVMPLRDQIRWAEDGVRAARMTGNVSVQCNLLHGLSSGYMFRMDFQSALNALQQCLDLAKKSGLKKWEGRALKMMATHMSFKGRPIEALPFAYEAAQILAEINDPDAADAVDLVQSLEARTSKAHDISNRPFWKVP